MTSKLGSEVVTVKRAPLVIDPRDHTPYRDWDAATLTEVTNCMVEPFPMAEKLNFEDNRDREFARTAVRFYLPADTSVEYTDRLIWEGNEYQVFGHPGLWKNFRGKSHHIAVIGQRREG